MLDNNNKSFNVRFFLIIIPVGFFYLLNALTPFWWDDFVMACCLDTWESPHTQLLSSFSDIIDSTRNIYKNWHGRTVVDFMNFLFMYLKNKTLFNICNTVIFGLFILLVYYHIIGTLKRFRWWLYPVIVIILWFVVPEWGQNFLWLTGSLNYLWTSTIILWFLIPYRKGITDHKFSPSVPFSVFWILPGLLSGWSIENSATGVFILLVGYFISRHLKRERVRLFELFGALGFLIGFFLLLNSRESLFPGIMRFIKNSIRVIIQFFRTDIILITLIAMVYVELRVGKKEKPGIASILFLCAAVGSVISMVIPGYFSGRSVFITQVFLIISLFSAGWQFVDGLSRRYRYMALLLLCSVFLPGFFTGLKDIAKGYILVNARDTAIYDEKGKGNMDISVNVPLPVFDRHSGLHHGFDALCDPSNPEFIVHNSAKATWYGVNSLTGKKTVYTNNLTKSIMSYLRKKHPDGFNMRDLYRTVYENW